ncbi:hypothetical protein [Pseudobutyrivibrio xylanivorans]|uniref:Lipopolysaccharide biosynthesis protein n=1 Tax=Pseudobutyrivibrio xylanivorans TaxID=185007 RepID=A0A5P6VUM5_PSEXY|nr:hypothetical protein [Pseudobutyrivibrio xylanivorans]QFJ56346.1 hypothetical protein FXF36_15640 [Pseudobutyrivibrio xylanivorans]
MDQIEKQISEKVVLVNHVDDGEVEIDLFNVFGLMGQMKKLVSLLLILAILVGAVLGVLYSGFEHLSGKGSYARAMVTFQFEGIDQGLDPNGASFDVNLIKSPYVIQNALDEIGGYSENYIETIRQNISIQGVVPKDAVEKITTIEKMAEKDATQYEKVLDVAYFPSQYIVYLYDDGTFSPKEMTQILDQILLSYKQYFLDTYANTNALTVTSNLLKEDDYDYGESVDLVKTQIQLMLSYVNEKMVEAPDFRSSRTGLSFEDIVTALQFVQDVDLARLTSFIESSSLTKERNRQLEYYQYMIRETSNKIAEKQTQLESIENTIASYQKDPVVIVSGADSTLEYGEKSEYYDDMISKKTAINKEISELNTRLNEYYIKYNALVEHEAISSSTSEYEYADKLLAKLDDTIASWVAQIEETTQEYYSTTLYSNAVKIAVAPQYYVDGGIVHIAKNMAVPAGVLVLLVLIWWFGHGVREELKTSKKKEKVEE